MDRLQTAFATVTPAQARLLWRLLAGYIEDAPEWEHQASASDLIEVQAAEALLVKCDAAVAGEEVR